MSAPTSEEVAADFQDSLDDLKINDRYMISNLTIIAKENIEHAQALSKTLESHIRKSTPTRKLPALYLLDSIVKNVGSPYTIYLGRNLFSTFFDAYTLVDSVTRKSMEALFKTWKQPIAGSTDPTPVFPPEITQKLDESLIRAKAATQKYPPPLQAQRPMPQDYRNTPTPTQNIGRYATPQQPPQQYQNGHASHQPTPPPGGTPVIDADFARRILAGLGQKQDDLSKLKEDIKNLINHTQSEFARNPYDQSSQVRLKALFQLSNILDTQQLSPEAIAAIKAQVSSLSAGIRPASAQPSLPMPGQNGAWQAPTPVASTPAQPYRAPSVQPNLPILHNLPVSTHSPLPSLVAPAMPSQGNALIEQLRAAGLLPNNASTPTQPPTLPAMPLTMPPSMPPIMPPTMPPSGLPQLPDAASLSRLLANMPTLAKPLAGSGKPRIPLSQTGLKAGIPTSLLTALYDPASTRCTTCGRRFADTPAGRTQKSNHIDWHFRTNQKIADATHRSQHRSWYPDEHEWIATKDIDPSSGIPDAVVSSTAKSDKGPGKKSIPAPVEMGVNKECPICQDRFEQIFDADSQEWVWLDATRPDPRGKVYHASCYEEVHGKKRKAEEPLGGKGKGVKVN
ncbi:hypothetical protein MBLNU457_3728t1 [Dothideomycetes sp. NU457]